MKPAAWKRREKHLALQEALNRAHMKDLAEKYDSKAQIYSAIITVVLVAVCVIFLWVLGGYLGFSPTLGIVLTLLLAPLLWYGCYRLYLAYPSTVASGRARKIDAAFPHTVSFMYAMSRAGATLLDTFRAISKREHEFGEIAEEAKLVVKEVDHLGHNLPTALIRVSEITPSRSFKTFLEVLTSVAEAGGDVAEYFATKYDDYIKEARGIQRKFLDVLGLFAEIYITLAVFGVMLFVVVIAVLSMIPGGGGIGGALLPILIYAIPPLVAIVFIIVLDMVAPPAAKAKPKAGLALAPPEVKTESVEEKRRLKALFEFRKKRKSALRDPISVFLDNPFWVLAVSVPAALIFLGVWMCLGPLTLLSLFITGLVAGIPFMVAVEFKIRRLSKIEDTMPDFLRGLSSSIKSGLSVPRSIELMTATPMGPLTPEVEKVHRDIAWGGSTSEALDRFDKRVKSSVISHAVALINESGASEEELGDVLDIAATDALTSVEMKRERKGEMVVYTMILYIAFVAFLAISYFLVSGLLGMTEALARAEMAEATAEGMVELATVLGLGSQFAHGALIQALCIGLVVGKMTTGQVVLGVKHSLIMLTVGYLFFMLLMPAVI